MNFEDKLQNGVEKKINFESDENGFVDFGSVSRQLLKKQCQYGSRYVDGLLEDYPNLGSGLRIKGNSDNYHELKIHKDDIDKFIKRYNDYLAKENL